MQSELAEQLRYRTVQVILGVRAQYLAGGGKALKHWDQISDRMRAAARSSGSAAEWVTALCRSLQVGAPDSSTSSATCELVNLLNEAGATRGWLDLIESEHGYLIAMARLESERRRADRAAEQHRKQEAAARAAADATPTLFGTLGA